VFIFWKIRFIESVFQPRDFRCKRDTNGLDSVWGPEWVFRVAGEDLTWRHAPARRLEVDNVASKEVIIKREGNYRAAREI
jgi:hypothetical protein